VGQFALDKIEETKDSHYFLKAFKCLSVRAAGQTSKKHTPLLVIFLVLQARS
jgi:hypothetical protein